MCSILCDIVVCTWCLVCNAYTFTATCVVFCVVSYGMSFRMHLVCDAYTFTAIYVVLCVVLYGMSFGMHLVCDAYTFTAICMWAAARASGSIQVSHS